MKLHFDNYKPFTDNTDKTTPTELETINHWGIDARATGSVKQGVYDFENGKDTGFRAGSLRNFNADVTEIDAEIDRISGRIQRQKAEAKEKIKELKALKAEASKLSDNNGNSIINPNSNAVDN